MANITLMGASYTDVPAVTLPQTGGGTVTFYENGGGTPAISVVDTTDSHGGTVRTITALDISDTTAVASDVAQGKYFYTAQGIKTAGTGSGGSPSATQHTIYFEFSDSTNTTITAYWDDSFISNSITATTPTTYGGKTVTLAQLDGVTWYEPASIPLNTQLIDFASVRTGYTIDDNGDIISSDAWNCVTDYTAIESTMTFSFKCRQYASIGFYDSGKNAIGTVQADSIKDSATDYVASGSLTPSIIPIGARYVAMVGHTYGVSDTLSLIRTA